MPRRQCADAHRQISTVSRFRIGLLRSPAVVSATLLPLLGAGAVDGGLDSHRLSAVVHHVAGVVGGPARPVADIVRSTVDPDRSETIQVRTPAARVETALLTASPSDRSQVLAAAAAAGSLQQPYVLKAFAAGHSADEVVRFADSINGRSPVWLRKHLNLIEPDGPWLVTYHAALVKQVDDTTCGSTVIVMARAMTDPIYAFDLTTGGGTRAAATADEFEARLAAEEQRIHGATNTLWPEKLGTTPSGISAELNRHVDALGARYEVRIAGQAPGGRKARHAAVAAAESGQPVPVLVGDWLPRHYVLLIGVDRAGLLFYEPTEATLVRIGIQDFLGGDVSALGFPHVHAVITPSH
ncbi:hypothetical protein EV652_113119 [Kribbella steppae]|uniref:Uncharacterized protein n=1 Tax=Kribbella steppae TaxID=2512223 RepID=A0A4R2H362_9ACTN|nr:hypothetical protein [Kribbella steppae]TCO19720.1 hypothetical protein EV652_113119 [Kribbella steppae]